MGTEGKDLHHANLLVASPKEAEEYLRSLCESLGIGLANNPDFFIFSMKTFGIEEARELRLLSGRKAVTTARVGQETGQVSKKIFLITPMRLTIEAQNALLKTFEDPFPNTHFFLAVREEGLVVPTLRSRMQIIQTARHSASRFEAAEEFLSLSVKDRLLFAKKFADEQNNLLIFLDSLLLLLRTRERGKKLVKRVYCLRRLIQDPLAARLVIEHVSLVL